MPELAFSMASSVARPDLRALSATCGAGCAHGRKKFSSLYFSTLDFLFSSSAPFVWELEVRSMATLYPYLRSAYRRCLSELGSERGVEIRAIVPTSGNASEFFSLAVG